MALVDILNGDTGASVRATLNLAIDAVNSLTFTAFLTNEGANILAERNGTAAQVFRVYNTYTDPSNYERFMLDWSATSNLLTIGTESAGTGTARDLMVKSATGKSYFSISNILSACCIDSGNLAFSCFSGTHLSSEYSGYGIALVSSLVLSWASSTTECKSGIDTGISRSAAGVVAFGNGSAGDGSATIIAKTKAGAPTTSDVPAGTWAVIRDTSGATTKLYYNNAGALQSVALT